MTTIAEKINAANDAGKRSREREVPEWGVTVYVKSWSGKERAEFWKLAKEFQKRLKDRGETDDPLTDSEMHAEICVRGLVDESGSAIFNGEGVEILTGKNSQIVKEIADEILEHNGLGKSAQERAEKNSMSSQSLDSGFDSLAT